MLYDLISDEEKEKLSSYIQSFAGDGAQAIIPTVDLEYLLREWEKSKQKLAKLFDNKLVISKEFIYNKEQYSVDLEVAEMASMKNDFAKKFGIFYNSLRNAMATVKDHLVYYNIPSFDVFFNYGNLITNTYLAHDFTIELPEHKRITIKNKEKMLKAIGKIINEFCPELKDDYEQFRIGHSMAIGRKETKAIVYLSIHPLDFMTMSDTPYFTSCMNWQMDGDYRQGTIEMMNSPCIIMAYIKGAKPLKWYDNFEDKTYEWNGKRWRELFIVDENLISNIRGYPFEVDSLDIQILEWIKELVKSKNIFNTHFTSNIRNKKQIESSNIKLIIDTNWMYNDYRNQKERLKFDFISDELIQITNELGIYAYFLNYSGSRECMYCGELDFYDFAREESHLVCDCCLDRDEEWYEDEDTEF